MSTSLSPSSSLPSVVCSNLVFSWPDDAPLFTDLSFAVGAGRTGLIAPNGAGKSTLLRLIAGELRPTAGALTVAGTIGYLPQTLPLIDEGTVAELLGVATTIEALNALAAGDFRDAVFAVIGEDWAVEERARAQLDRVGLAHIALDRPLRTLSGGEVITVGVARELLRRPDVLLLDEPTNNLDTDARHRLHSALGDFTGCLLLVSHDRALLDRMDRIAELYDGEIAFHGGNFSAYQDAVAEARLSAQSALRHAEQQLIRQKRQRQQARERAARRSGTAKRNVKDAGLPKIIAGALKRRAQQSAGRSDDVHAKRIDDAKARRDDAEHALRNDEFLALDLPDTSVPPGRTVLDIEGLRISRGGRVLVTGADLVVRGPGRIALTGPNGAGKTTLLRALLREVEPDDGAIRVADGRVGHLSQRLDLLDDDTSVSENLAIAAPSLSVTRRRHLLAQLLFRGDDVERQVRTLSGGERLRATLACVLFAEPAPQLLLLDEPTNNLDLVSVGQLENALAAYRGAFIVVSHDASFLDAIGAHRVVRLADGELTEV